jgi:hypothetical protein
LNADAEAALSTELDFFKNKKSATKKAPVKEASKHKGTGTVFKNWSSLEHGPREDRLTAYS